MARLLCELKYHRNKYFADGFNTFMETIYRNSLPKISFLLLTEN